MSGFGWELVMATATSDKPEFTIQRVPAALHQDVPTALVLPAACTVCGGVLWGGAGVECVGCHRRCHRHCVRNAPSCPSTGQRAITPGIVLVSAAADTPLPPQGYRLCVAPFVEEYCTPYHLHLAEDNADPWNPPTLIRLPHAANGRILVSLQAPPAASKDPVASGRRIDSVVVEGLIPATDDVRSVHIDGTSYTLRIACRFLPRVSVDAVGFPTPPSQLVAQARSRDSLKLTSLRAMARTAQLLSPPCDAEILRSAADTEGFPDEYRGLLWRRALLLHFPRAMHDAFAPMAAAPLAALRQIQLDLPRTAASHVYLATPVGQASLLYVLERVARGPCGYTQGINLLAGFLLMVTSEAEACWMLFALIHNLLPDYFAPGMAGVLVDLKLVHAIVRDRDAALDAHITSLAPLMEMAVARWLLCAFVAVLPSGAVLRVWDLLVSHGRDALAATAAALLLLHAPTLRRAGSIEAGAEALTRLSSSLHDWRPLITLVVEILSGKVAQDMRRTLSDVVVSP